MLYWLLVPLKKHFFFFNVFSYITVRTAMAGITAFLLTLILGPWVIKTLKKYQIKEELRPYSPETHTGKKGTPSMGGILIIFGSLFPTILWGDLSNTYVWLAMGTMFFFGLLGFEDDFLKIKMKKPLGLVARHKLVFQIILSALIAFILVYLGLIGKFNLHLSFPFFKQWTPYLGWFYLPWIIFILVGSSNAVNLADGLDGLAIGLTIISASAFTALSYIAGHALWSEYLEILRVPQASELTVFAGAMSGACLGFLWYNSHPAQIFMGDAGALSIGGTLGTLSIMIKQEFLLFMVAGVFILEALSVLLQVSYFKLSGGKRILRMAPLHHHFELIGWSEQKIVVRFWIAGIFFALFSLTTLKLR
ncbi:phospho-N-acetylmuramoyl-pentapeptide-transferase [bacterium]|nr:phospho-N-acetylmuramoyl-pentapeptide-transferase [bacterium]